MHAVFVGGGGVEGFDVQVLHIGAIVGESPGDAIVVANDHERGARQSEAFDVPARGGDVDFVPDGREHQLQVRIVGEQRLSGCGVRAADHAVVAAQAASNFVLDIEQ